MKTLAYDLEVHGGGVYTCLIGGNASEVPCIRQTHRRNGQDAGYLYFRRLSRPLALFVTQFLEKERVKAHCHHSKKHRRDQKLTKNQCSKAMDGKHNHRDPTWPEVCVQVMLAS